MREYTDQVIILNAAAANGVSSAINMAGFRHIEFQIAQTGFSGTIKFAGSNADAAPDFSAAASASNPWDYIQVIDQIDGSGINGGTGITSVTITSVRNVETNSNGFKWVAVIISGYTAGSVSIKGKGFNQS